MKIFKYLLLFLIIFLIPLKTESLPEIPKSKILIIIASSNFRDEEYQIPREIFQRQKAKVTVASSSLSTSVGMLGARVNPDILLKDVKVKDFDAIVFVGGVGAKEYFNDKEAHRIVKEAVKEKKLLAAICLAPVILAKAGILKSRKATVWEDAKGEITKYGAEYIPNKVVVDGRIITAPGPDFAKKFAEKIVEKIYVGRINDRIVIPPIDLKK